MRRPARAVSMVTFAAALALAGAACGDDDLDAAANGDLSDEFCQARVDVEEALVAEDQDAVGPALDALDEHGPDALAEQVAAFTAGFRDDPEAAFEDPEVVQARQAIDDAVLDGCGFETVEATGVDFGYEGLPETVEAGTVGFRLTNSGEELHEIAILRVNDGVTDSAEEILNLPEEEAMQTAAFVGAAFARPDETDTTIGVYEPGRYIVACFIPVGTTLDTEGSGPPHFTEGMVAEFEVTDD